MLVNFFLGGLIGIIYYLIICQISNNLFCENKNIYNSQNSILFLYFGGLIGLFLGSNIFSNNKKLNNSAIKIGLYFGSSFLIFNSMIINWDNMNSQTKLLLLGINFGLIIWFSYFNKKINKKSKKKNKKLETETISDTTLESSSEG